MTAAQQALRLGRPLWIRQGDGRAQRYASLSGKHATSVAIVGGGITGALIAHAFASAGVSATVLEGGVVGGGSTAASSALLLQEPDSELAELAERYGMRASRRIWQMSRDSTRSLIRLVRRLSIPCDLTPSDAIYYATDADTVARLRAEYELRDRCGFEAAWLGPGDLRRHTGISARGAIRTKGSAQFDPYRACLGVMRSAVAAGAQVFERSRVRRIVTDGDRVRLWTRDGMLESERVVIATGYATPEFRPLAGRFRMYRTYVLATEPVTAPARRDLGLPNDVMVWDTGRPYHYARWAPEHRLLLGGGDRLVRSGARRQQQFAAAARELRAYFETRFPALSEIRQEFAWEGLFAMTPDSLPYIGPHRRYPRHWFALGYGGNGMTFGFLAARLLLERWQGETSRDHALFEFGRMGRR
jgi:glycine/D-amino acid oxidase-like deaminating enzyme